MKKGTLYLAEVYLSNPEDQTPGWDIQMVWVYADDSQHARERLAKEVPFFDEVIQLGEQSEIVPLAGCIGQVLQSY